MAMAGKTERRMAMDYREKFPGCPDRFFASHGTIIKSRNVKSKDINFVNE